MVISTGHCWLTVDILLANHQAQVNWMVLWRKVTDVFSDIQARGGYYYPICGTMQNSIAIVMFWLNLQHNNGRISQVSLDLAFFEYVDQNVVIVQCVRQSVCQWCLVYLDWPHTACDTGNLVILILWRSWWLFTSNQWAKFTVCGLKMIAQLTETHV